MQVLDQKLSIKEKVGANNISTDGKRDITLNEKIKGKEFVISFSKFQSRVFPEYSIRNLPLEYMIDDLPVDHVFWMQHRNPGHTIETGGHHVKIIAYPYHIRIWVIGVNDGIVVSFILAVQVGQTGKKHTESY